MLLCQPEDEPGIATSEPPFIAIDLFGAALHQRVFVSTDGIAARGVVHDDHSPVRNYVQGVIDE